MRSQSTIHNPQSTSSVPWSLGPLILLCVALFLAPLIGGTVSTDSMSLEPGYSPLMKAIFGGAEAPMLSHFVIATLLCTSAAWILVSRRVVQVPMPLFSIFLIALIGFVAGSTLFSAFRFTSFAAAFEWSVYAVGCFVAVAVVGRKQGPVAALSSLHAGTSILALIAIVEYFKQPDSTWRVFGTWQNPNALAGMLVIGLFIGCGLTMALKNLPAIFCGAGTVLIGFALALTQSKGGFLAAAFGLFALLVLGLAWIRKDQGPIKLLGRVAVCVIAIVGLLALLRMKPSGEGGSAPLSRVAQSSETQEQSAGFRILLWKSAAKLIAEKPLGYGIGSYRHESARPGLTTQTHLAHNSYLQVAAEAGIAGVFALVLVVGGWLVYAFKGARKQDPAMTPLKIGAVSAVAAAIAHNMVDSDLYFFGTGLVFFVLLGVGLQLNTDGVTPESVQRTPRWSAFAVCLLIPIALFYFGVVEVTKAHVRARLSQGALGEAQEGARELASFAGSDGESRYLAGLLAASSNERLEHLRAAAENAPTTKNLRALAREQQAAGNTAAASASLAKALERDPNNLLTLKKLLELNLALKNEEEIERVARRLVDVEKTTYFKTRALPELVPTETYFARKVLADSALTPKQKIELLEPAVEGLREYALKTVPNVVRMAEAGMREFAGESVGSAKEKLDLGTQAALSFLKASEILGDKARIAKAGVSLEAIEKAINELEELE